MREILFRGKQKAGDYWICGDLRQWSETRKGILDYTFGGTREVYPETIGQFTGLTDKSGKKIFEGDIVKIPDDYDTYGLNAGEIYVINFMLGGFRLKPKYRNTVGFWLEDDGELEIIGNIHDNPELLED